MKTNFICLFLFAMMLLSACGQSGALYLPEKPQPQVANAAAEKTNQP